MKEGSKAKLSNIPMEHSAREGTNSGQNHNKKSRKNDTITGKHNAEYAQNIVGSTKNDFVSIEALHKSTLNYSFSNDFEYEGKNNKEGRPNNLDSIQETAKCSKKRKLNIQKLTPNTPKI